MARLGNEAQIPRLTLVNGYLLCGLLYKCIGRRTQRTQRNVRCPCRTALTFENRSLLYVHRYGRGESKYHHLPVDKLPRTLLGLCPWIPLGNFVPTLR